MEDKIRLDFLSRINQMAEEMVQERFRLMETDFEGPLPAIMKDLSTRMGSVMEQYQRQQKAEENGPLRWIYLSFLRSSVLNGAPCHRLDFYDERNQISEQECVGAWEFECVFRHMREIHHQLQIEFRGQTRVEECELDAVIYYLAERLKKEAERLIPEPSSKFLGEYRADMFEDETMDFMLGELFDKSELAAQWRPQKEKSDEGETDG